MGGVLELCCFEWFQNRQIIVQVFNVRFRAVLFRMVPKPCSAYVLAEIRFRAVLFRMVPKRLISQKTTEPSFRAVLFRMVPKRVRS